MLYLCNIFSFTDLLILLYSGQERNQNMQGIVGRGSVQWSVFVGLITVQLLVITIYRLPFLQTFLHNEPLPPPLKDKSFTVCAVIIGTVKLGLTLFFSLFEQEAEI